MSNEIKFYMSRYVEGQWEEAISLTDYFNGLGYSKSKGLSSKGKIKNIYTESYPESSELRVYIPEDVARENTDIEFEFCFKGEYRRDIFDQFVSWLSGYKIKYWDTGRNRIAYMILVEAIEPDEDELYGSEPYIKATFKFKNLKGDTEKAV